MEWWHLGTYYPLEASHLKELTSFDILKISLQLWISKNKKGKKSKNHKEKINFSAFFFL